MFICSTIIVIRTTFRDALLEERPLVQSATANTAPTLDVNDDEEDFEVLLDTGNVLVIRMNGVHVAQVQSPVDLGELGWQLASIGYVTEEIISFDGGVIEMQLRPLGEVPMHVSEEEQKIMSDIQKLVKKREGIYA